MDQQQNNKKSSDFIQTYSEDIVKVFETGQVGAGIKEMLHNEEEQEQVRKNLSPQSAKNRAFMFVGLILLTISFGTLIFFLSQEYTPSVPANPQFVPLIFNDKVSLVDISGLRKEYIAPKIVSSVDTGKMKDSSLMGIYLSYDKAPVGLRKFVEILESSFTPGSTILVDDNFLLGVIKHEQNDFFILLKTRSMADIFIPLHNWENKMFEELHDLFGVPLSPETKYLLTKNFEDGIVENKNARILYDTEGNIVMMYVFADNNSVIIADTREAVREIILRLASSTLKK